MAWQSSNSANGKRLIALFQGKAKEGEPAHNLRIMKEQTEKAALAGADMIIFEELFLAGYSLSKKDLRRLAEEKGGPSFQELSATARESGVAVVYGYSEVDRSSGKEEFYNSAQLIDKDGQALVNHRKVHLYVRGDPAEAVEAAFSPGQEFAIAECCGMKVAIVICYDIEFPEVARVLALKGVQLIAVPSSIHSDPKWCGVTDYLVPARARENRIHVAYVNHAHGKYGGHSVVCNPDGDVVVKGGEEEVLLLANIDLGYNFEWSYLVDRRPDLYGEITA